MGIQEIYQNILTNRDGEIDQDYTIWIEYSILIGSFFSNERPSEVVELLKKPLSRSQSVKRRVRDDNASYAARQFGDPWFMGPQSWPFDLNIQMNSPGIPDLSQMFLGRVHFMEQSFKFVDESKLDFWYCQYDIE